MRLIWQREYIGGRNLSVQTVDTDHRDNNGTVDKPNRTTFSASVCRAVILKARTPEGLEKARAVLRKHGLTTREIDQLLRDMAPYYRSFRR